MIIAFFPCTYFECQSQMFFYGSHQSLTNASDKKKLETAMSRHEKLHEFYMTLSKMCCVCIDKGIKLVIENPYNNPHYLRSYWCLRPAVIDSDRTERGDYYKKPTQYWFINCEPKNNLIFEPLEYVEQRRIAGKTVDGIQKTAARSIIHPQYANRFIREHLI